VIRHGEALPKVDWQCPLLSLPLAFGTELNTVPAEVPYIYADPCPAEAWRRRLPGNSLRIGLAWGGSQLHPHDDLRSVPLELLAPLTRIEGTTFYSLQMGAPAEQIKQLRDRVRLVDLQNEQKDFADTAAIVASLDLVISIDTSVAHLAGAMGKPVWVILSKSADWRWLLDRKDSPWYPTARLFRQSTPGNWQEVVTRVERELRERLQQAMAAGTRADSPSWRIAGGLTAAPLELASGPG
jgi:ADP-heptose:LPS heptosyltransferase